MVFKSYQQILKAKSFIQKMRLETRSACLQYRRVMKKKAINVLSSLNNLERDLIARSQHLIHQEQKSLERIIGQTTKDSEALKSKNCPDFAAIENRLISQVGELTVKTKEQLLPIQRQIEEIESLKRQIGFLTGLKRMRRA